MIVMDSSNRPSAHGSRLGDRELGREAISVFPQLLWTADQDGLILEVGPLWTAVTGHPREGARGVGWRDVVHPDDLDDVDRQWAAAVGSGAVYDTEYRAIDAGGHYRWFRVRAAPWRDKDGRIGRWYGTMEDVHDRRIAEAALRQSENFARSVLEHIPECIKVLDFEGRVIFQSDPGLALMEIADFESVRGKPWDQYWPVEARETVGAAVAKARAGETVRFVGFGPTLQGKPKWWDNLLAPLPEDVGCPARILAISRDVTDTIMARQEADATAAKLSAVLESTTDSVFMLDREWRITYVNHPAAGALAARRVTLGASFWDLFPGEPDGVFAKDLRRAMADQVAVEVVECFAPLGLWLEMHVFPTPDGLSIFCRDVTERRRVEKERWLAQMQIAHMARHDALTGLPNRALFHERLQRALAEAAHGESVAVLCLDLDSFATINDTLGQGAGDFVLRQVATRLLGCLREWETVARTGGDEFAIIQTGIRRPEEAEQLAKQVLDSIGQPYLVGGQKIGLSTCVGIAMAAVQESGDEIVKRADFALYSAKGTQYGSFRFFETGMDESLRARQALKIKLTGALARGEFDVHYQPVINLRDGRLMSFEALLRWRHPERGFVSPVEFVPIAEETGQILALGDWVLCEACQAATHWPEDVGVAVNLSSLQFGGRNLVQVVTSALAASGLAAGRLELEITETVLLQENDGNLATLQALRDLGLRIAMDDFGTGYSSLGYLRKFSFDKIKIDRSFIDDLPNGKESGAIVRTVVSLGTSLGIVTTAEGVSTQLQCDWLRAQGCDQGQGFLFSRPVPAGQVLGLIARFRGVGAVG